MIIINGKSLNGKSFLIIIAAILMAGCLSSEKSESPGAAGMNEGTGIPDNYYFSLKAADTDSPIELLRFATSIRPESSGLDIPMRAAYYQWYLKNRGFNVSFAYSDNFRNQGAEHVWLLVKNQQGESMYVDPSSEKVKADSICPTMPEYRNYQRIFPDIYELSENTGGSSKYAWWNTESGKKLFDGSVMLLKKEQL